MAPDRHTSGKKIAIAPAAPVMTRDAMGKGKRQVVAYEADCVFCGM